MQHIRQQITSLKEEIQDFHQNVNLGEVQDFQPINQKLVNVFQEISKHNCFSELGNEISELTNHLHQLNKTSIEAYKDVLASLKNLNQHKQANIGYGKSIKSINDNKAL
ncbi:hypothetical protein NF27_DT00710 [Candidatus Jidaibacter acanthamoeba]|uniref:Uncharacterized protein n=1 Tax=Candidatus Jidaibacter acanthamoebae TaxID=86105 RepID=A0A0C1MT60_9RICK|nr:hypothetical protein [Candidatus Jidaibacter acanthamoeba]KIE05297.1 hypothetical protein NF27_DT00710 [Candidatus Jidaibacter acanthamoeba]